MASAATECASIVRSCDVPDAALSLKPAAQRLSNIFGHFFFVVVVVYLSPLCNVYACICGVIIMGV